MATTCKRRRSNAQRQNEVSRIYGELDFLQQSLEEGMLEYEESYAPPANKSSALKSVPQSTHKSESNPSSKSSDADDVLYDEQVLHPSFHNQPKSLPTDLLKPDPFFYYNDYSRAADHDADKELVPEGWAGNFPLKLHAILMRKDLGDAAMWMPHGRSFRISNPRDFEARAVIKYFSNGKFSLFIRQMKAWGFRRITSPGPDRNSYYHEMFLRGMPHLIKLMTYHGKVNEVDSQFDPRFDEISAIFPVPEKVMNPDTESVLSSELKIGGHMESQACPSFKVQNILSNLAQGTNYDLSDDLIASCPTDQGHKRVKTAGAPVLAGQYAPLAEEQENGSGLLSTSYALERRSFESALSLIPPRNLEARSAFPTDDLGLLELLQNKTASEMVKTVVSPLADRLNAAEDVIRIQQEQILQLQNLLTQCIGATIPVEQLWG